MITLSKNRFVRLTPILLVLLIPLIAMFFTDEVHWSVLDFIIMGVLLFSAAVLCDVVLRKVKIENRIYLIIGIVIVFLLIWAELAVGIFGTPFAGS